jgi:multiple antibiotic resistance protein
MGLKEFLSTWLNAFLGLFAILNPLGNIGLFVENTASLNRRERFRVFNLTSLAAFATLLLLTLFGKWIMVHVFGISIQEFKIAGGVLLTVIAVQRILFSKKAGRESEGGDVYEQAVVPMAVPLLVGPGAIATSLLIYDRDGPVVSIGSLVAVSLVTWGILQASHFLKRIMGKFGVMVVSRILFIFIAAIGVRFLLSGLSEYFGIG